MGGVAFVSTKDATWIPSRQDRKFVDICLSGPESVRRKSTRSVRNLPASCEIPSAPMARFNPDAAHKTGEGIDPEPLCGVPRNKMEEAEVEILL